MSTPVTWEEVQKCLKKRDSQVLVFDSKQVLERVAKLGDLFAPVQTLKQRLPEVTELTGEAAPRAASKSRSSTPGKNPATKKRVTAKPRSEAKRAG